MEKEYYQKEVFWTSNTFWDTVPITDSLIKEAEDRLEIQLPLSYLQLLRVQNGGSINFPYFDLGDRLVWMDYLFGIDLDDADRGIGILASAALVKERKLPVPHSRVIIIWGDFHHFIGLDYRDRKENPSVVYFWETQEDDSPWGVRQLSPTFDEFLSKLYRKPSNPMKIKNKKVYKQKINLKYAKNLTQFKLSKRSFFAHKNRIINAVHSSRYD